MINRNGLDCNKSQTKKCKKLHEQLAVNTRPTATKWLEQILNEKNHSNSTPIFIIETHTTQHSTMVVAVKAREKKSKRTPSNSSTRTICKLLCTQQNAWYLLVNWVNNNEFITQSFFYIEKGRRKNSEKKMCVTALAGLLNRFEY